MSIDPRSTEYSVQQAFEAGLESGKRYERNIAKQLYEALKQALAVSQSCCTCCQIYADCDNDHVYGLEKWTAALAAYEEARK